MGRVKGREGLILYMGDVEIVIKVPEGVDGKKVKEKVEELVFWEKVKEYTGKVDYGAFGNGTAEEFERAREEVYEQ